MEDLPKNFVILKVIKKQINDKKIVSITYKEDEQKFVQQKREDKSLAGFLSRSNECQKEKP